MNTGNHPDEVVGQSTLRFIESRRGQLLLHAGGTCTTCGKTVIVHGESGVGKTTLTTALALQGLSYISDETLCIDPRTLQIEPFRKPLTIKPGSQEALRFLRPPRNEVSEGSGNWQISPERLGGPDLPDAPLVPAVIVFPDFGEEHVGVEITSVSPARAAFVLGEQSSAMWAIEPRPLAVVARLVNSTPAYEVSYSDAFEAAPVIVRDLLGRATAELEASEGDSDVSSLKTQDRRGGEMDASESDAKQRIPTGSIGPRREKGVDWMLLDDEAVLFDGTHLHYLDSPGAAVWQALDGERTLEAVAADLAKQFNADEKQVRLDVEDLVRVFRSRTLVT